MSLSLKALHVPILCSPEDKWNGNIEVAFYCTIGHFCFQNNLERSKRGEKNKGKKVEEKELKKLVGCWKGQKPSPDTGTKKSQPPPPPADWAVKEFMQMSSAPALPLPLSLHSLSLQICVCAAGRKEIRDWGSLWGRLEKGGSRGLPASHSLIHGKSFRTYSDGGTQTSKRSHILKCALSSLLISICHKFHFF